MLEHEGRFTAGQRAELLAEYAIECYTIGAIDKAVEAEWRAVDLNRSLGDLRQLGACLRWLSRISWTAGDRANAEQAGREAVDVLEQAEDARLLALALNNESQLCMLAHRLAESIGYGERAAALAREVGDAATASHALTNIGASQWLLGDPAGQRTLDEGLRVALAAGDVEDACRAYVNLIWNLLDWFRLDEAERYLTAAMKLAGARVADVGCGHGASTTLMARAFPNSSFTGSDYHEGSIIQARKRVADAGLAGQVSFDVASAQTFDGGPYDLVTSFDCLHDMGDPLGAARHIREMLAPDGTWMVVEPYAGSSVTDNLNPVGRVYYSFSTFLCVPNALSQEGGYSLGAQAGEEAIRRLTADAGYAGFRRVAETPFNIIYEVRP